jgi:DNA-binding NarL/FixJ family response regulator
MDTHRSADVLPGRNTEPPRHLASGASRRSSDEASTAAEPDGSLDVCGREGSLHVRTRERYVTVRQLLADGASLAEIGRQLELDCTAVRRFATPPASTNPS